MFTERSLFTMPKGVQTRWASPENWQGEKGVGGQQGHGRKGSAWFALKAGEQRTLAEVAHTSGTVRRIWATIRDRSPAMLRGLRLDIYWDGVDTPAVSAPIGDFFGHPLGQCITFESALFSSPEGRSFNCCIPMPFRTGMRIVVGNESGIDLDNFFTMWTTRLATRTATTCCIFTPIGGAKTPPIYSKTTKCCRWCAGGAFFGHERRHYCRYESLRNVVVGRGRN